MNPFDIQKRLYGEMGDYANQLKKNQLRSQYAPKPAEPPVPGAPMDNDAVIDSIQMPPTDEAGLKALQGVQAQAAPNAELADAVTNENKSVIDGLSDDELLEMLNTKY